LACRPPGEAAKREKGKKEEANLGPVGNRTHLPNLSGTGMFRKRLDPRDAGKQAGLKNPEAIFH